MGRVFLVAFLLALVCSPLRAEEDSGYTMDELETLALKKAWSEIILRLPAVLPADRGSKWEDLVEQAAIGHLKDLAKESIDSSVDNAEVLVNKFPSLARSRKFEEEKYRIALMGFELCFSNKADAPECEKRLLEYVKRGRNIMELAFRAGKLVSKHGRHEAALPFYSMAITTITRPGFCPADEVLVSVINGLTSPQRKTRELAREIADRQCWGHIQPTLLKAVERQPAGLLKSEACGLLKKKGELPPKLFLQCETKPAPKQN